MPDIALVASADPATAMPVLDVSLTSVPEGAESVARDVALDSGLDTAVYISLFTDARADPAGARDPTDLRGWWGDEFGPIGSRLWELTRGKATDEVVEFARTAAADSLRWMLDLGVASSIDVQSTRIGLYAISIVVRIQRPRGASPTLRYALDWAATV